VVAFFEKVLRHSKGQNAGKPFTLLPWQHHVLRELFGRLNPDGTRQHRVGYIELPKKQGKSTTLAGIALYMTAFDSEPGAEVYGAACDREQAGIIYREAASMVRASPALSRHLEVIDSRKTIVHKASNSFYRVLSADAFRAEGLNIHALLFDELHAQRDRRLWAFAPGREAGGEGPAQQEMHSGTAGRLGDHHYCCRSPRRASTARASAGSSTSTPSGASQIRE
jgi:phage terminase large subunit-like protein